MDIDRICCPGGCLGRFFVLITDFPRARAPARYYPYTGRKNKFRAGAWARTRARKMLKYNASARIMAGNS